MILKEDFDIFWDIFSLFSANRAPGNLIKKLISKIPAVPRLHRPCYSLTDAVSTGESIICFLLN